MKLDSDCVSSAVCKPIFEEMLLEKYLENDHDLIEFFLSSRLVDCFV